MQILCAICSDLVNEGENIYVTNCGHIFHYSCLAQWLARSKSCPQCRNKVTDRCMFRLYPTISDENTAEATTLRSQLDDAQFQLRQKRASKKEKEERLASVTADLKKQQELHKNLEKKLLNHEFAVSGLKSQLAYMKIQNRETQKLREENESLLKNIQTLNGLQHLLNTTSDEMEQWLRDYPDVRIIATFTTVLKRGLCESEGKEKELRNRLRELKQQLLNESKTVADLQAKLLQAETRLSSMQRKRKSESLDMSMGDEHMRPSYEGFNDDAVLNETDGRFPSGFLISAKNAVTKKPSEVKQLNNQTNIFRKKQELKIDLSVSHPDMFYDGLGGHSKLDTFPKPCTRPPVKKLKPKLSAKHKLKRPNPSPDNVSIKKMFEKMQNSKVESVGLNIK